MAEKILKTEYSEEMQRSYLDYSMSVITARAVPDIRDGLKPVQRRLLYDMNDLHVNHDKKEMKSARIAGDCMGRFHPHGDSSIYETMVVMAQPFKKSVPLVDGKGNFGSIEGDSAAAYRYTEAKLRKFTDDVFLRDLDKSVDFMPAYTNTEEEPVVLPVRIPNFLLNGSEGIAVGMTTSVPCHNLAELCDLCVAYVDRPDMTVPEMLAIMPGPDFPTGGIIANKSDLAAIYETGSGRLKLRGRLSFEPGKKRSEKDKLVVTEIPYTMIGAGIGKFMSDTAELVEAKKLPEIRRFMDYYLPTTLKLLNAYDRMDATGISGDNIDTTKAKVEKMLDTIVRAFDKQLDALFGEEALDISTDITVMENLLAQEGLTGMTLDGDGDRHDINLEL